MEITALHGIGPARSAALAAAGIATVADLLAYYPRDYDDRSEIRTVDSLLVGTVQTLRGVLREKAETMPLPRRAGAGKGGRSFTITKAQLRDGTGVLELVWFNQPYLEKNLAVGREYVFTGAVRLAPKGHLQMQSPEYEAVGDITLGAGRIVPLYTPPKGFSQKIFRALVHQALEMAGDACGEAVRNIHFPESDEKFLEARRKLVFDELFAVQVALLQLKSKAAAQPGLLFKDIDAAPLAARLDFTLTAAQRRVLGEISADMASGRAMNRLIQGDVGSGKTAVAMAASYIAVKNGTQAVIMAPTEVLACQHYEGFSRVFGDMGITTALLTGTMGAAARKEARKQIADGTAEVIIGTHALLQKGVRYARPGLVVTDEQHRFGVNQRFTLMGKGVSSPTDTFPHTLVMTATPIPRTLALILYGDMDISVIDTLPPGRLPICTYAVDSRYRKRIHAFIRKETGAGRQGYIICPAINAIEAAEEINNVTAYTLALQKALPDVRIACMHGRMKPADKQAIMAGFKSGAIQVLISTTVIEVGVHVANATLMVIENVERFGLSQLHQLRGRVGRGAHASYCILVTDSKSKVTQARMQAMTESTDGFALAERDLEQRGGGDFFGTRQHGLPAFKIANLYRDADIVKEVQAAAREYVKNNGKLMDINLMAVL